MYKHLSEQYERNVFLAEKKKHEAKAPAPSPKKDNKVKTKVTPGKGFEEDETLLAGFKKTGPVPVKGVKKPKPMHTEEFTGFSKFDSIFQRALCEDIEQDSTTTLPAAGTQMEPASAESTESEHDETTDEVESEDTGDIIADLQDVVGKLNDILQSLGAPQEDEESEESEEGEEGGDVNDDINDVEGKTAETAEQGVTESLKDLKSAIHGLKTKLSTLTGKQNKVSTSLKVTKGKAAASEHSGKALPSKIDHLQSKSHQKVDSKLKVGGSLFERRGR